MTKEEENYLFIDENVTVSTAAAAREALSRQNDLRFLSDDAGIVVVSPERWTLAQHAERRHWMELGIRADDDHNYRNAAGFDFYEPLRGMCFSSAIELGCGPFTNLRIIGDVCRIQSCDLLDPLVESYLAHPFCRYTHTSVTVDRTHLPALARRFILRHPTLGLLRYAQHGRIPVGRLLSVPIEQMPLDRRYDLVVMENVLEHCYDAPLVFSNIRAISRPGSMIVMFDRYYDSNTVKDAANRVWDAAHPLRVDRRVIDQFLEAAFQRVYSKVTPVRARFKGIDASADHFYFIGRRTV